MPRLPKANCSAHVPSLRHSIAPSLPSPLAPSRCRPSQQRASPDQVLTDHHHTHLTTPPVLAAFLHTTPPATTAAMVYEDMTSASASLMLRARLLGLAEERKAKEPTQAELEAAEARMAERRNRKTFMERFGMTGKEVRKLVTFTPQRSGRQKLLEGRITDLKKQAEKGGAGAPAQHAKPKSRKTRARTRAKKYGVKTRKAVNA